MRRMTAAILIGLLLAGGAEAQSLWKDNANLYSDARPSAVGDIVTVLVSETTSTKDEAKTDITKSNKTDVKDGWGILDFIKALGFQSDSNMKGDGSTERKHTVNAKVSCIVTQVLPNGNLVIEGVRDLKTHNEVLKVAYSGVIRPRDVGHDNTIKSELVANPELRVEGRGSLSRVQKPGLITQVLQALF